MMGSAQLRRLLLGLVWALITLTAAAQQEPVSAAAVQSGAEPAAQEQPAPVANADAESATVSETHAPETPASETVAAEKQSVDRTAGPESIVITRKPAASPNSVANSSTLLSVMLALLAVVVMIFGTAWVIKRFTGLSAVNNRQIKVLATLPVGARERVVLVEVGDQQLLLGVTPQQINTLHTFKEPVVFADKPGATDFAQRLQAILSRGNSQ